jgi:hypothetical protein
MNAEEVKAVVNRNVFGYLDNNVTRIARTLPNVVVSGASTTVKSSNEAASKAVTVRPTAPGQFRELGGGGLSAIGGGGLGSSGAEEVDDRALAKARKAAQKEEDDRSALFALAGGGSAAVGAGASASSSSSSAAQDGGADDADPFHAAGAPDGGDYDYEAAFRDMQFGGGDAGDGGDQAGAATSNAGAAPGPGAAPEAHEDFGLM